MKIISPILISVMFCTSSFAQKQKIISDYTLQYSVTNENAAVKDIGSKTIYIKGKDIRVELVTKTFSQTVFYNSSTGDATVLKNVGESKYISQYNPEEWKKENNIYDGVTVSFTDSTKTIFDYKCKQAILTLKGGRKYVVYFTPELVPSIAEKPFDTKNIPGLVLEYQSTLRNNGKITYTAQKIDFKPVPASKFDIPQEGYRILH